MANKAAWLTGAKVKPFKIDDAPMPVPKTNEVVIKNRAVAINPVDWGMQAFDFIPLPYSYIEGCDVAGEITTVGSVVKDFKTGDRIIAVMVAFVTHNVSNAAFQMFSLAGDNSIAKIPENISYTEASVLPLAISTAASALFQDNNLALPLPQINPKPTGNIYNLILLVQL